MPPARMALWKASPKCAPVPMTSPVERISGPSSGSTAGNLLNGNTDSFATHGTAAAIQKAGIECEGVNKVKEGRPHCVDMIKNGEIQLIANTTEGKQSIEESRSIRASAIQNKVCYFTTIAGALAAAAAMDHLDRLDVNRLQSLHASLQ